MLLGRVRHARRAGGFSLLELALATVVGAALLWILFGVLGAGARTMQGVEANLDALRSAQVQLERIETDLHHLILRSKDDLSVFSGLTVGTGARNALRFHVGEVGPSGRNPAYVGRPVEYRAVPAEGGFFHLARNGAVDRQLLLARLSFELFVKDSMDGTYRNHFIRTTMVGADPKGLRQFTLQGLVAVDIVSEWQRARSFNPNPDLQSPVLAFPGAAAVAPAGR